MRIAEAGGGGYGDPKARARAAVADDVAQGYVSAAAAGETYGASVENDAGREPER